MKQARVTLGVLLSAALMLLPMAARADYAIKDGNAASQTIKAFTCGSAICPGYVPMDLTGAAFGVTGNPFFINFAAGATLPPFATTPTFNCGTGCSSTGGTFNNNSDAVATSSTNGQSASWMYGFNGTTWDRVRTDTTNGVWVNVKTLPPLAATSTKQSDGSQKSQTVDGSGNVQPSGDVAARARFEKVTDGTNTAAVKPASTAPAATDPAVVVGLSPNGNSVTVASGADVTLGSIGDTTCPATGNATVMGCARVTAQAAQGANPVSVNGTVTAQTGVTPGNAQTGTIVAGNEDVTSVGGKAVPKGGVPVINGGNTYNTVAASQTAQALTGGSGGATGDYLSHCVVQPTTTAAGTVTILDNATIIFTFTTGTLSNLVPFAIPVGANSVSGAWKITTGANETVTCVGKFS